VHVGCNATPLQGKKGADRLKISILLSIHDFYYSIYQNPKSEYVPSLTLIGEYVPLHLWQHRENGAAFASIN